MTKPIIIVKVPCKLLYVIQVKEFLIKCSTFWTYLISEFLVAYITIVASDWPRTFFTPKVFMFSIDYIGSAVFYRFYKFIYIGYQKSHIGASLVLLEYMYSLNMVTVLLEYIELGILNNNGDCFIRVY